ncbi:MAG: hypothetical protein QMD50_01990, partial [Patescibacteria group bacterium]|nr:hypothetical protein [Patescibacteria group bacterium]
AYFSDVLLGSTGRWLSSAASHPQSNCYWLYTGGGAMVCPNGYYVAGIQPTSAEAWNLYTLCCAF